MTNTPIERCMCTFLFRFSISGTMMAVAIAASAQWNQLGMDLEGGIDEASAGWSVDINEDGTVVAVGSKAGWANGFDDAGEAKAFQWNGEAWEPRGLPLLGEAEYEWLGQSVSLNAAGDVMAVGSTNAQNANGVSVGRVQVLAWDGAAWSQMGEDLLGLESPTLTTFYGHAVDLSADGHSIAIGGPFRWSVDESLSDVGYVEVYDWTGETWVLRGEAIYGSEEHNMWLGFDVALSADGQTLVTGAPSFGPGWQENSRGLVRVYEWEDGGWTAKGQDFLGALPGDDAGRSVSIANGGNTIAFSAPLSDFMVPGNFDGEVMVYDWDSDVWVLRGDTLSSMEFHDEFGESVSLSSDGMRLAIGAPAVGNSAALASMAGMGAVYEWQGNGWVQIGAPILGEETMEFAHEVALSGDGSTFILGSFGFDPHGRARVYHDEDWVGSRDRIPVLESITCFPNPSTGPVTVEGFEGVARLELHSALGQLVSFWDGCSAPFKLDLSRFADGVYTLHGQTGTLHFTNRIALQR